MHHATSSVFSFLKNMNSFLAMQEALLIFILLVYLK